MRLILFVTIFVVTISSCDSNSIRLTDEFELSWVIDNSYQTIRYKNEGILPSYIWEVEYNSNYIIAKHKILNLKNEDKISEEDFYIIDIKMFKRFYPREKRGVYGPFSIEKLDSIKSVYSIKSVVIK